MILKSILQNTGQKLALSVADILNDILNLPEIYTESKTNQTPVTIADLLIQITVMLTLVELYPQDHFIGEETLEEKKIVELEKLLKQANLYDKYFHRLNEFKRKILPNYQEFLFVICNPAASPRVWINDPLDGTTNFIKKNGHRKGARLRSTLA